MSKHKFLVELHSKLSHYLESNDIVEYEEIVEILDEFTSFNANNMLNNKKESYYKDSYIYEVISHQTTKIKRNMEEIKRLIIVNRNIFEFLDYLQYDKTDDLSSNYVRAIKFDKLNNEMIVTDTEEYCHDLVNIKRPGKYKKMVKLSKTDGNHKKFRSSKLKKKHKMLTLYKQ